jgi:hypothetical protein
MMSVIKGSKNPQAMLNQLMGQNPQFKEVMSIINENGGDAKKAFYSLAQKRGVDPEQILNMLR